MSGIAFAIPGDIDLPTGGYAYDRRLLQEWRQAGIPARHLALPGFFPFPGEADIAATEALLASAAPGETLLIDGLAFGAFPEELARRFGDRIVALVHHPLALETGLSGPQEEALRASERAALRHARAVIVTSPPTKDILVSDFGVPEQSVAIAIPGTDPAPRTLARAATETVRLLAVGSLIPRKGYEVLLAALATIADRPWHLTIAGSPDHAPATAASLQQTVAGQGWSQRVAFAGAVDAERLDTLYATADIFVMPSLYEGYGMVLTEALARGLPIVCSRRGAGAEALPEAAALKTPPGDVAALAKALATLIDAPSERIARADAAWAGAAALPRWRDTARTVAEACLGAGARMN
ncbi:glycosyltransferase family 4 protein [Bosea sp. (in: a-proteobacteria)]|uniref:glycosyltransferase family 4 protein n=1 Tax=Bosea sp. (in: a-proteobacteria) TaxID=1871050 RepID=UPI003B3BCA03